MWLCSSLSRRSRSTCGPLRQSSGRGDKGRLWLHKRQSCPQLCSFISSLIPANSSVRCTLYSRLCVWRSKNKTRFLFSSCVQSGGCLGGKEWPFLGGIRAEHGQVRGKGRWRIKEIRLTLWGREEVWIGGRYAAFQCPKRASVVRS